MNPREADDVSLQNPADEACSLHRRELHSLVSGNGRGAYAVFREQPRSFLVAVFTGMSGLCIGWDVGYIGSLLEMDSFMHDINEGKPLSGSESGSLVSIMSAGSIVALLPCCLGWLTEKLGRRRVLILGGCLAICGAAVQATARDLAQMYAGRFVLGFAGGLLTVTAVYQAEVAPAETRGAMMGMLPLGITFGIFAATACDNFLKHVEHGWVYCIWPIAAFGAILVGGMACFPESPRHLMESGGEAKAMAALLWLRRGAPLGSVERELAAIVAEVHAGRMDNGGATCSSMASGFMCRLLALGTVGWLLFQCCGMPALTYFGPRMFAMARIDALVFQMTSSFLGFAMTFPALWAVDRFGRRSILRWGAAGMTLGSLGLGVAGTLFVRIPTRCPGQSDASVCAHSPGRPDGEVDAATQWAIVVSSLVFVASYSLSWGMVMNVFGNEIYPVKYRTRAVAFVNLASYLGNVFMGQVTPLVMDSIHFEVFLIFSLVDVVCWCYALWIPETAGVPLEGLIALFEKRFGVEYNDPSPAIEQTTAGSPP